MKIKRALSFVFDSAYFLFTAVSCIFLFFFISDKLAVETSSPNIFATLAVLVYLLPIYLLYSAISKKLE